MLDFGGTVSYPPSVLELTLLDVEDHVERRFRSSRPFVYVAQEPVKCRGFRAFWGIRKVVLCDELVGDNQIEISDIERLQRPRRDIIRFGWRPRYLVFTVELWDRDGVEIEEPVVHVTYLLGKGIREPEQSFPLSAVDEILAYAKRTLPRDFHNYLRK